MNDVKKRSVGGSADDPAAYILVYQRSRTKCSISAPLPKLPVDETSCSDDDNEKSTPTKEGKSEQAKRASETHGGMKDAEDKAENGSKDKRDQDKDPGRSDETMVKNHSQNDASSDGNNKRGRTNHNLGDAQNGAKSNSTKKTGQKKKDLQKSLKKSIQFDFDSDSEATFSECASESDIEAQTYTHVENETDVTESSISAPIKENEGTEEE